MWRSSLWSISWLRHQMFYPYVTISAAQARKSDDLHHAISPFTFFLSSFTGMKNPGICEAMKDHRSASSKRRKRRSICGMHLEEPLNWNGLCAALWRNWPSIAPPRDAVPELRRNMCVKLCIYWVFKPIAVPFTWWLVTVVSKCESEIHVGLVWRD